MSRAHSASFTHSFKHTFDHVKSRDTELFATPSNVCLNEWVKLAEWARDNSVHPQTAYRWFREGKMAVPARRLESGTIWVDAPSTGKAGTDGRVVVYARVSSHDQRGDLDRQVARLTQWATSSGHAIGGGGL